MPGAETALGAAGKVPNLAFLWEFYQQETSWQHRPHAAFPTPQPLSFLWLILPEVSPTSSSAPVGACAGPCPLPPTPAGAGGEGWGHWQLSPLEVVQVFIAHKEKVLWERPGVRKPRLLGGLRSVCAWWMA